MNAALSSPVAAPAPQVPLGACADGTAPSVPATPALEALGVSVRYGSGALQVGALRAVDLRIGAGEIVALQGPSGSGKSTLLQVCGLLQQPQEGEVRLAGAPVRTLGERGRALLRRSHIGFVFQNFHLVPVMTAFENIEYPLLLLGLGRAERRRRVTDMMDRLGLEGLAHRRPDELSGGQRQRVAIGRALVKRPRLVIADEPTANLDSATAAQIVDLMQETGSDGHTSFLVATHDPATAARCGRVLRLQDGAFA